MRGRTCVLEMDENSYVGVTDSGGSPDGVPTRRQRHEVLVRRGGDPSQPREEGLAVGAADVHSDASSEPRS